MPSLFDIVNALKYGASAVAKSPFKSIGKNTITMHPQKYLDLAMPFGALGGPKLDPEKVANLAKLQKWNTNPMLSVKEGPESALQVGIHDGRHRAAAALSRGDTEMPVDIVRGKKFARENPDISDSDMAQRVINEGLLPEHYGLDLSPLPKAPE